MGSALSESAAPACQVTVFLHLPQHHIASPDGILRIETRIEHGIGLEHAGEAGPPPPPSGQQPSAEITLRGCLNSVNVLAERNCVKVKVKYLVFCEDLFNPFSQGITSLVLSG